MNDSHIIDAYSRKEALEDGEQICLSDKFPDECKLYKYPVYCTLEVWILIESAVNNPKFANDFAGIVWDILFMSTKAPGRKMLNEFTCEFVLIVQGANRKPDYQSDRLPHYRLISQCGPNDIDDPSPCITLMMPEEQ
jgi:hypothetical protein